MENLIVIIFDDELKAYDAFRALSVLDQEGSISVHAKAVVTKNTEGKTIVKQEEDSPPISTVGGTAIGALIGLFGGPIGLGVGAMSGALTGSILDLERAGVDSEFVDEAYSKLTPGKWAVVADISEEWQTPVDARMAALGGIVLRSPRRSVEAQQDEKDTAAIKAEIVQLQEEEVKAEADQKGKIKDKIAFWKKKYNDKLEKAKQRRKQRQDEANAKVNALEAKAAKAHADSKAKIQARIAQIKEENKREDEAFDRWTKKNEEDVEIWMTGEANA